MPVFMQWGAVWWRLLSFMKPLIFLAAVVVSVHAYDWPQFRGPTADGVSTDTHLPLTWSEKENLVWRTKLPGPGSSSPVISSGKVFLTCYSGYGIDVKNPGDMKNLKRHALCLDGQSGKILWNHEITTDLPNQPFTGTYITTHGYASSSAVTVDCGPIARWVSVLRAARKSLAGDVCSRSEPGRSVSDQRAGSGT